MQINEDAMSKMPTIARLDELTKAIEDVRIDALFPEGGLNEELLNDANLGPVGTHYLILALSQLEIAAQHVKLARHYVLTKKSP
jgi:hypothetical protein